MANWASIKRFFRQRFLFIPEEATAATYEEVKEGTEIKGHNLWMLGFAMIIACVGLNTNSTSAVIGAMLISPLMGPIVGFAFGLAINDNQLKRNSLRNWVWMVLISLLASVLFFLISPFNNNTDALNSFRQATIFDILLALFGGMAGFIGVLKKEGTRVIAGVAVATACMPPLCTAGFGLAHADWVTFLGGLYFFLINCLFIGCGTFLLARMAGFHVTKQPYVEKNTSIFLWWTLIVIMLVPASYIAFQKWKQERKTATATTTPEQRIEQLEKKVQQLDSLLRSK